MNKVFFSTIYTLCMLLGIAVKGQHAEDTTTVQVFTFEDIKKRRTQIEFPAKSPGNWEKIYMIRTLLCDEKSPLDKYPCGEWDYSTHTKIYKHHSKDSIEVFELENYVTPYGKRLNLGPDGFTYTYDVTDYAPILKGNVDISSGNGAELLDLKFLFVRGTPARTILSVENLYPWGSYKYEDLSDDKILTQQKIYLREDAKTFMLRARISGHGHFGPRNCCEWEGKTHTYLLNNEMAFRWLIWKNCGDNPIYPQGGTWQFDRAGWCPGTPVDTYDYELTPLVTPGDTVTIDYTIEPYSDNGEKEGSYIQSHQIFSYSAPNFKNDATVADIISPSSKDVYSRINPICNDPEIVIQNTGKNTLKSLTIHYGLKGAQQYSFKWYGKLEFLEKETVQLPGVPMQEAIANRDFVVTVDKPNGMRDEYPRNNTLKSVVKLPKLLPANFTLAIDANDRGRAYETSWTLSNAEGEIFYEQEKLKDGEEIRLPIENLTPGCYELRIVDTKQDGMIRHWWNRGRAPEKVGRNGRIAILDEKGELVKELKYDFAEEEIFRFIVE